MNVITCNWVAVILEYKKQADDKTRNPGFPSGIPGGIYSRFYVIATSSCTSRVGVCCRLLNLSMDNNTILGFPDTSGDYRSLNSKYGTPYKPETLPRSQPRCTGLVGQGPMNTLGPTQLLLVQCSAVLDNFLLLCIFLASKLNSH